MQHQRRERGFNIGQTEMLTLLLFYNLIVLKFICHFIKKSLWQVLIRVRGTTELNAAMCAPAVFLMADLTPNRHTLITCRYTKCCGRCRHERSCRSEREDAVRGPLQLIRHKSLRAQVHKTSHESKIKNPTMNNVTDVTGRRQVRSTGFLLSSIVALEMLIVISF